MKDVDCGAGLEEKDPAHETQGNVATWDKPGTLEVVHGDDRSSHEWSTSVTT